jgi:hypothetical protein
MLIKLCISLGVAFIAAVITATVGFMHDARPLTVLYRAAISLVGFSLGGFLAAILIEQYIKRRFPDVKPAGQNIDIISKEGILDNDELLNPSQPAQSFRPFVPENFKHLTVKE